METAVRAYLKDTLGIDAPITLWSGAGSLPYFLVDAFDLKALAILGHPVLLAIDKRADRPGLASIRAQIDKIREVTGLPVLYATEALASYERKRLIEQKVPFVVPGNQLYLPDLGLDLREYFRKPAAQPQSEISPAAQAMLISVLLGANFQCCHTARLDRPMHFSSSVSNCVRAAQNKSHHFSHRSIEPCHQIRRRETRQED